MPINSIEVASRYSEELDKMFAQKSVTGFLADNNMRTKFVGAKTVIIPDVDFQGLVDYDKDSGFSRGAITVGNTSFTLQRDRARSIQIDREDLDETGIAALAGKILGEFVRTKAVPESDAYVLSKLAGSAILSDNLVDGSVSAPYAAFMNLATAVRNAVGYDEELVCFIRSDIYAKIANSTELSRMISVSDFKHGDINLKVKSIDGITLLPTVAERMKTAYTFGTSGAGGFTPASNAKNIYMLMLPKSGAHLVMKTENLRIFTPEQNIDADAYKFDYRVYYDVFVKKSERAAIWAWIAPAVTISTQPADASKTAGSISGSLSISASAASGTLSYQWYEASGTDKSGGKRISGATSSSMTIPTTLTAGSYYYYVKLFVDGMEAVDSTVATVTVASA